MSGKLRITMNISRRKVIIRLAGISCLLGFFLLWWIGWGAWPNPEPKPLPWRPDVIMVLGGGNEERSREALRLVKKYPEVSIVVTGDSGIMLAPLLEAGISKSKIHHEQAATSTIENAQFTDPILTKLGAKRVVLVTNWFHVPRSLAVFCQYQPQREFAAAFERRPEKMQNWHRYSSRRERLAALFYVVRHQIWAF